MDITPEHLNLIKDILTSHLKPNTRVWIFGSRSRGSAKPFSDCDLAIDNNGKPVSLSTLSALDFDFEESDLPYKVDLIDWNTIETSFQDAIRGELKVIF